MKSIVRIALAASVAMATVPAVALDDTQKKEFGDFIHEYLVTHPEVLFEAQKEWNRRQEAQTEAKRKLALGGYLATIDGSKRHAVMGNPAGDVTLVEFFDYNCGYCRRAIGDMEKLVKADPKLRIVLMELPVIRQESLGAAQVSIAVNRIAPGKFGEFHDRLLGGQALATKARALKVAGDMGLDAAAIETAIRAPDNEATLLEAKKMADDLGVEATPTYVVGDEVVPNTTSVVDDLQGRIAALRTCGKAEC